MSECYVKLYYDTFYPEEGGGGTQVYCRKQEKGERELCFEVAKTAIFKKICIFFKKLSTFLTLLTGGASWYLTFGFSALAF